MRGGDAMPGRRCLLQVGVFEYVTCIVSFVKYKAYWGAHSIRRQYMTLEGVGGPIRVILSGV